MLDGLRTMDDPGIQPRERPAPTIGTPLRPHRRARRRWAGDAVVVVTLALLGWLTHAALG